LVDSVESMMMHGLANPKSQNIICLQFLIVVAVVYPKDTQIGNRVQYHINKKIGFGGELTRNKFNIHGSVYRINILAYNSN